MKERIARANWEKQSGARASAIAFGVGVIALSFLVFLFTLAIRHG
jgi:hypothetical protein